MLRVECGFKQRQTFFLQNSKPYALQLRKLQVGTNDGGDAMRAYLGAVAAIAMMTAVNVSFAGAPPPLGPHHTEGFGAGKLLNFSYHENYDCVELPSDDLDFDKQPAELDADELQIPICQAGTNPRRNPPGTFGFATITTDPLYVLVPMFSVDKDQNPGDAISCKDVTPGTICGRALGEALIKFFGALPEAFKTRPMVYTQCPAPRDRQGTCTMHASRIDLAPVLAALGYIDNPPKANVFVPSPNHSHVLDDADINKGDEWWQVLPVLVMHKSDWPPEDGSSGITSVAKLDAAEQAGRAIEAPSNFFLFFGSQVQGGGAHMKMHMR